MNQQGVSKPKSRRLPVGHDLERAAESLGCELCSTFAFMNLPKKDMSEVARAVVTASRKDCLKCALCRFGEAQPHKTRPR